MAIQTNSPTRADPTPFFLEGGPVGVLMVHGFTGSPAELRPVADELNRRGLTVDVPLLPGHGTTPDDCNRSTLNDWCACVEDACARLRDRCATVFMAGLSLGSLLTLRFAAQHPELPGIILYALPLGTTDRREKLIPYLRFLVKTMPKDEPNVFDAAQIANTWDYPVWPLRASNEALKLVKEVRATMPRVMCPVLLISSAGDDFVRGSGPQEALSLIGSQDKTLVMLQGCGHVLTVGASALEAAAKTYEFIAVRAAV
jgi:carboxylesterase